MMLEDGEGHLNYDAVLHQVNGHSSWQWRIHCLLWASSIASGLSYNSVRILDNFHGGFVRCRNPYCEDKYSDSTWYDFHKYHVTVNFQSLSENCTRRTLQALPPPDKPSQLSCNAYMEALNQSADLIRFQPCPANETIFYNNNLKQIENLADMDIFAENLQLFCNQGHLILKLPTIILLSYIIGVPIIGIISDVRGRVAGLLFSLFLLTISGLGEVFTVHFELFGVLTFLRSMGIYGTFLTSLLLNIEILQPRWMSSNLIFLAFEVGKFLALFPLGLIKGIWYHVIIHVLTSFLLLAFWFILPESPRWLLARKQYREYTNLIETITRTNNDPNMVS